MYPSSQLVRYYKARLLQASIVSLYLYNTIKKKNNENDLGDEMVIQV